MWKQKIVVSKDSFESKQFLFLATGKETWEMIMTNLFLRPIFSSRIPEIDDGRKGYLKRALRNASLLKDPLHRDSLRILYIGTLMYFNGNKKEY